MSCSAGGANRTRLEAPPGSSVASALKGKSKLNEARQGEGTNQKELEG
ncbi:MAG: hypothetical protein LBH85_00320 [Treponema sp.]|nr:hypothetical protein [Treponema sp.]